MSAFPSTEEFDKYAAVDKKIRQAKDWKNLPASVIYRVKSKEEVETELGKYPLLQLVNRDNEEISVWAPPSVMLALCDPYPKKKIPYIRRLDTQWNKFQTVFLRDRKTSKKVVKKGIKKYVTKNMVKRGIKRHAEEAMCSNKVRKVEESTTFSVNSPSVSESTSAGSESSSSV